MIDLADRVAIVSGAGGGLGRAHAILPAQRRARVVVNDLDSSAEKVTQEINDAGPQARAFQGSATNSAGVQERWKRNRRKRFRYQ